MNVVALSKAFHSAVLAVVSPTTPANLIFLPVSSLFQLLESDTLVSSKMTQFTRSSA